MPKIMVAIRLKPEESKNISQQLQCKATSIEVTPPGGSKHDFTFDKLFQQSSSQKSIFDGCAMSMIDEVLEGFNGSVLTYGQTGSGKTYTMSGPSNDDAAFEGQGLVMRSAGYIFEKARRLLAPDSISVRLSVLEIYNETLIDLLREPPPALVLPGTVLPPKLTIIETAGGVVVPALYIMPLASAEDSYGLLLEAWSNRVVAEHQLNRRSSRSHVVYTFYITRTKSDDDVVQSKLNLVDLAGSERTEKTGSVGSVQKEANHINRSLSYLEQVVLALTQSKRDHIPYRQSKLTHLLKDSLGGNSNTVLVACIWPHMAHVWETLSTLRFATRMKCIENTPVRTNLVANEPSSVRLLQQIDALKKELAMRDIMSDSSSQASSQVGEAWLHDLTKLQKSRTVRLASLIAVDQPTERDLSTVSEDMELKSLAQCRFLVGVLRSIIWEIAEQDHSKILDAANRVSSMILGNGSASIPLGNTHAEDDAVSATAMSSKEAENATFPSARTPSNVNSPPKKIANIKNKATVEQQDYTGKVSDEALIWPSDDVSDVSTRLDLQSPVLSPTDNAAIHQPDQEIHTVQTLPVLSFDQFSRGPGKELHDSYTDAKETLRKNKVRQREIVGLLNKLKGKIDDITNQIKLKTTSIKLISSERERLMPSSSSMKGVSMLDSEDVNTTDLESRLTSSNTEIVTTLNPTDTSARDSTDDSECDAGVHGGDSLTLIALRTELESIKREYRDAHAELQLCKDQVTETVSLKKRVMTTLLQAFEDYGK